MNMMPNERCSERRHRVTVAIDPSRGPVAELGSLGGAFTSRPITVH